MVGFAQNVPVILTEHSARTRESSSRSVTSRARVAQSINTGKHQTVTWKTTGEEPKAQPIEVPDATSITILTTPTGAGVPSRSADANDTNYFRVYNRPPSEKHILASKLTNLSLRGRLVTNFEPHLRQATVENLQALFTQFRHSLGTPSAAVVKAELVDTLTKAYKKSALNPETRNFASAISLIQDFLRPHWSELQPETVGAVTGTISGLVSRNELTPAVLEHFYRDLLGIVGTGISTNVEFDDEDIDMEPE